MLGYQSLEEDLTNWAAENVLDFAPLKRSQGMLDE